MMDVVLSKNPQKLFIAYVVDAPNWGGAPLVGGNVTVLGEPKRDRALLVHLKKQGLIRVVQSEEAPRVFWLYFTGKGKEYAQSLGLETANLSVCDQEK